MMTRLLKMFQKSMEESGDGVLNTPTGPISELKGVKVRLYKG